MMRPILVVIARVNAGLESTGSRETIDSAEVRRTPPPVEGERRNAVEQREVEIDPAGPKQDVRQQEHPALAEYRQRADDIVEASVGLDEAREVEAEVGIDDRGERKDEQEQQRDRNAITHVAGENRQEIVGRVRHHADAVDADPAQRRTPDDPDEGLIGVVGVAAEVDAVLGGLAVGVGDDRDGVARRSIFECGGHVIEPDGTFAIDACDDDPLVGRHTLGSQRTVLGRGRQHAERAGCGSFFARRSVAIGQGDGRPVCGRRLDLRLGRHWRPIDGGDRIIGCEPLAAREWRIPGHRGDECRAFEHHRPPVGEFDRQRLVVARFEGRRQVRRRVDRLAVDGDDPIASSDVCIGSSASRKHPADGRTR